MNRTAPAIALLASAVVLSIAGCGSSSDSDSASTSANRQAAAGKLAYRAYGSRIDVQGGASGIEWPCKNVGSLAADSTGSGPANQSRAPSRKRARQPV